MQYFTSDTHFCHRNIIRLCNRPFESLEEMHQVLITQWNSKVRPRDEVYILGDFGFRGSGEEMNAVTRELNGRKYLIRGNHDQFLDDATFDQNLFEWVKDYHVLKNNKRKLILFHYPIWEWDGYCRDAIHLFGHIHYPEKAHEIEMERSVDDSCCISVCSDVNDFTPLSIAEIFAKAEVIRESLR